MDATPDAYRAAIGHTQEHIALIDAGECLFDTLAQAGARRAALVCQLAALEERLERAEREWSQAQARGAGRRKEG